MLPDIREHIYLTMTTIRFIAILISAYTICTDTCKKNMNDDGRK